MTPAWKIVNKLSRLCAPPPKQTLSAWAEENIRLSSEYSAETGRFRCKPFQREVFDAFSDPRVSTIVVMSATQLTKTMVIQAALGFVIDKDPGPMLLVFPNDTDASEFSKERLAPFIRDTLCLTAKVAKSKSRDSQNSIDHKSFPGGYLTLVGSISPAGLSRRPIRYLFCDEIDKYPSSAGSEGDPISLARKRTATYRNRKKIVMTCSPTVAGRSRIAKAYAASDQRSRWVPCHACGELQVLKWPQVKWDNTLPVEHRPETAHYECEHCGAVWTDVQRWAADDRGEWRAARPFTGTAGFWISELYSPWKTLGEIVADFLEKKNDRDQFKVFVNTTLAQLWEEAGETPDDEILYGRREDYPIGTVPPRGLFLTAGVDVQDDRLELEVIAWGRGKESWSVDYRVLEVRDAAGQRLRSSSPELWARLDEVLARDWPHANGGTMPISVMCIDTGDRPKPVYDFALRHAQPGYGPSGIRIFAPRTVVPIKGASKETLRIIAAVSGEDAARKRRGVRIVSVGVSVAKQELFDNLRLPRISLDETAPGYCHFPRYERVYFEGLCSEKRIVHENGSVSWEKQRRNEPLDVRVYGRAGAAVFGLDHFGERQWLKLEEMVKPLPGAVHEGREIPRPAPQRMIRRRVIGRFDL
jgi:phage terminase large subunit GpA-like protein